jgi:hypothetical protein
MAAMRRQLVAAAVPGLLLFGGLILAMVWPRQVISHEFSFAEGVVNSLSDRGFRVASIQRWSHLPFKNRSSAAMIQTTEGLVQIIVFDKERDLASFRVSETTSSTSGVSRYRYVVAGGPDGPEKTDWESAYPWFFRVDQNWLLITHDAALHQALGRGAGRLASIGTWGS